MKNPIANGMILISIFFVLFFGIVIAEASKDGVKDSSSINITKNFTNVTTPTNITINSSIKKILNYTIPRNVAILKYKNFA